MNLNYPTKKLRGPPAIARYVGAAFVLLTLAYLWVRIPLWNPATPILSSLLLAAEAFGLFTITTHALTTWHVLDRTAAPPSADMTADLFITTWNEPIEMLRNTLLAAKSVRRVGTVWLLDDGDRAEARALADELQVRYLTRQDRSHAKAGNLNNALAHCDAEFVAQFDCDHAPCVDFLEKTLGYFRDEKIAFVQTPQDFFNTDSYQHRTSIRDGQVWHEQTLFYDSIQKGKDRWNAAFFAAATRLCARRRCATSAVLPPAQLQRIFTHRYACTKAVGHRHFIRNLWPLGCRQWMPNNIFCSGCAGLAVPCRFGHANPS
jgi:cellulose synthase (UDP-forming)